MKQKLKIGVVGASCFSDCWYLPLLQKHPHVHLQAICSKTRENAKRLAEKYQIHHKKTTIWIFTKVFCKRYHNGRTLRKGDTLMSLHTSKIPIILHDLKRIAGIDAYYKNGIFYLETGEIEVENGLFVCLSGQHKLVELCRIINFYLYELDAHPQGA